MHNNSYSLFMGWHLWLSFAVFICVFFYLFQAYKNQNKERKNMKDRLKELYQKGELSEEEYEEELRKLN